MMCGQLFSAIPLTIMSFSFEKYNLSNVLYRCGSRSTPSKTNRIISQIYRLGVNSTRHYNTKRFSQPSTQRSPGLQSTIACKPGLTIQDIFQRDATGILPNSHTHMATSAAIICRTFATFAPWTCKLVIAAKCRIRGPPLRFCRPP